MAKQNLPKAETTGAMKSSSRRGGSSNDEGRKPPPTVKVPSFARPAHMETAKYQVDKKRQKKIDAAERDFLGVPPPGRGLIETRVVIPGGEMLPRGIENSARLDSIRQGHKVWITNVEPNIFSICGDSMPQLRQATRAFFDTLRDMRLANESSYTRFMVQKPCRDAPKATIRVELGSRAAMQLPFRDRAKPRDFSRVIDALATNIWTELQSNLKNLICCGTDLRMRINFGYLNILQKGLQGQLTRDEFARMIELNSNTRAGRLDTWLPSPPLAGLVCRHLVEPSKGTAICLDRESVRCSYSLTVSLDDQEVLLDAFVTPHLTQLSPVRVSRIEESSNFGCTVAAPDMAFDWNLRVDSLLVSRDMPSDIEELIKEVALRVPDPTELDFSPLCLAVSEPATWESKVSETKLRTSKIIPIRDTPFVVEVSVVQQWKGLRPPSRTPEAGWQIELYGIDWDVAMNQQRPGEQTKDWGADMENIWRGNGPSKGKASFREFIQAVLEVQAALSDVDMTEI